MEMRARRAQRDDGPLLLEWANDSLTRRMSFHPEPISDLRHGEWLEGVLSSVDTALCVVEVREERGWQPIAQVRLDPGGEVSFSLAAGYRGRGLAVPALEAGLRCALSTHREERLVAHVRPENPASVRVFERAGFRRVGPAEVHGCACLEYERCASRG